LIGENDPLRTSDSIDGCFHAPYSSTGKDRFQERNPVLDAPARRRLAAILVADVVGYSRLMGEDEERTRARFNAHLNERIAPRIGERHGRLVKTMGDGLLVEFASAIDAVRCAFDIQTAVAQSNSATPEGQRLNFRIGINLGNVIVEGEDIHGNGVNIAARLEGLADPGGIVISDVVYEITRAKVPFQFDDLGSKKVKNIAEPIRAFRIRSDEERARNGGPSVAGNRMSRPIPEKPSIAVLPFKSQGGDSEQEYFADGITEDLITDLSKISGLIVAARNSSFAFRNKDLDTREIAQRLGVRHILSGSVRRAGNRIRINAELVEAEFGDQLWADRFDGDFADIFVLQDDINTRIVCSLKVHLTPSEIDDTRRQEPPDPEAYDLCLKGRSEYYRYTPQALAKASGFFEQATVKDPNYAEAYAYLSYCRTSAHVFAMPGSDDTFEPAIALAEKAITLNDRSAVAYARLGWIQGFLGRSEEAMRNFEKSIAIDPRNAEAFYAYGETMNRLGNPQKAMPLLEKAFSIDTFVPPAWEFAKGHSYVLMQRHDEAVSEFLPIINRVPGFVPARVQLARTYAEMDRISDAEDIVRSIREIAPKYSLRSAARMFPYPDDANRTTLIGALKMAGLPQ
jgi:TolB-like protein